MDNLEWVKDEEVVFCPMNDEGLTRFRGASGIIISRQIGGKKNNKKVKSVLVRWKIHRKGVSCFRIQGQRRAKSDWVTSFLKKDKKGKSAWLNAPLPEVARFEEESKSLHPLSYCRDCPLRLKRLACPCEMSKTEAVKTNGQGYTSLWRSSPHYNAII